MDSGSTATDNFIIIGMSPKPTSDDDLYMKPNTKIENNDKTGEDSKRHSTTTKIGDSSNDIIPAKALGMKSIYVTYGYGKIENSIKPDYVIDCFNEVLKIIKF